MFCDWCGEELDEDDNGYDDGLALYCQSCVDCGHPEDSDDSPTTARS